MREPAAESGLREGRAATAAPRADPPGRLQDGDATRPEDIPAGRQRARPTVAIQGEPGCFSEAAARSMLPSPAIAGCRSFEDVAESVAAGEADYGLLPETNSLLGRVVDLDALLARYGLVAVDARSVPIRQCLIGVRPVALEDVREVRSHPVALRQCRRFLQRHTWMRPVPTADTAGAVREICQEGRAEVAAIAGPWAAELYGATVLVEDIADRADNVTRFVLFQRGR